MDLIKNGEMTRVIHSLVKNTGNQCAAIRLDCKEQHVTADMVGAKSGKDFVIGFADGCRSRSDFFHARGKKGIVRVSLFLGPSIYSVGPNAMR